MEQRINNVSIELGTCNDSELASLVGFYEGRINESMVALACIERLQFERKVQQPIPEQRDRDWEDMGGPAL